MKMSWVTVPNETVCVSHPPAGLHGEADTDPVPITAHEFSWAVQSMR